MPLCLAASSCLKEEYNQQDSRQNIQVAVSVGDLFLETRAVKKGWENEDIINIYLDDATSWRPDFQLTYDGSAWSSSELSDDFKALIKTTGGKLKGFWEGSNSAISGSEWNRTEDSIEYKLANAPKEGVPQYLIASFQDIDYSVESGVLKANINSWTLYPDFQIVVTGLPSGGTYAMYCDWIDYVKKIIVDTSVIETVKEATSSTKRIAGIANSDGIAFVGGLKSTHSSGETIKILLVTNAGTTSETLYALYKTLDKDLNSKMNAIKVSFSKFTKVQSILVPTAIDLGLPSGTKWGTFNIGASTPEDPGNYYAWAEIDAKDNYSWGTYFWCGGSNTSLLKYNYKSEYGTVDNKSSIEPADDAAYVRLSTNWRIPTSNQWGELMHASNCTWEWDATKKAYKVTSKVNGKNSFIPAAGDKTADTVKDLGVYGHYWSSSLSSDFPDLAWRLFFNKDNRERRDNSRYNGFTIRPVINP